MATGSEVSLAVAAHEQLVKDGIKSRVVSMPSWELFEHQTTGVQGLRPAPLRDGARVRRAGLDPGLGALHGPHRQEDRHADVRRLRPPQGAAEEVRLPARKRGGGGQGAARRQEAGMKIAVGSDHAGFLLKQEVAESLRQGRIRGRRRRHGLDGGRRLSRFRGEGRPGREGGPRRARRPHLRQRRRGLRGRQQGARHPRRHLPRHLLGPPGRRARRHERARPGRPRSSAPPSPTSWWRPTSRPATRRRSATPGAWPRSSRSRSGTDSSRGPLYRPRGRRRDGYLERTFVGGEPAGLACSNYGQSVWLDFIRAQPHHRRRAPAHARRGRPGRRHLQPRHLRQGHRRQRRLQGRRSQEISKDPVDRAQARLRAARDQGHPGRGRHPAAGVRPHQGPRRLREPGGGAGPRQRHARGRSRRRAASGRRSTVPTS